MEADDQQLAKYAAEDGNATKKPAGHLQSMVERYLYSTVELTRRGVDLPKPCSTPTEAFQLMALVAHRYESMAGDGGEGTPKANVLLYELHRAKGLIAEGAYEDAVCALRAMERVLETPTSQSPTPY